MRGLSPEAVRHVYMLAILPIMTYAAHALHLTQTDIVQWHRHGTLQCLVTIISLHFSIVIGVQMKFCLGGNSPVAWLFQNPRWRLNMATA